MAIYKKADNYYIDYYVSGRRKREMIGPNRKLAEAILAKRRVAIVEKRNLDIVPSKSVSFDEAAERFLEYSRVHKRSWCRDEELVAHLSGAFGGKPLGSIAVADVHRYQGDRAREVAPATVNREVACLKRIFNLCILWELARENPVAKAKMLPENNTRKRFLTEKEEALLLMHASRHLRPILVTALHTGMRKGEILNLKWADVDLGNRVIYVRFSKTGRSREVPVNDTLFETLGAIPRHLKSPYVFCDVSGKSYGEVKTGFHAALRRAGISDFRFHDLRHTFASRLVMAGVNLRAVQELMGHRTWEATLRYAHLADAQLREAVRKLDQSGLGMDTRMDTKAGEGGGGRGPRHATACAASG